MNIMNRILDAFGTGSETPDPSNVSNASPSRPLPVAEQAVSTMNREGADDLTRAKAYERYQDRPVRTDNHFSFHQRRVALSSIHARRRVQKDEDKKKVEDLTKDIETNGWQRHRGRLVVCDDSIVPPEGPGARVRSHLLSPTFSIVDGHCRIDALSLALKNGKAIPQMIIVEVAVPVRGTPIDAVEVCLLQMAMNLNQVFSNPKERASLSPRKNFVAGPRDLRRLTALRSWWLEHSEFATKPFNTIAYGDIASIAIKAAKDRALGESHISPKHIERYLRAMFTFEHSPEAFEIYKNSLNYKKLSAKLSIISISTATLLRSEPIEKALIMEAMFAHLKGRRGGFMRGRDYSFQRNFKALYLIVKEAAKGYGFEGTSFLNVRIAVPTRKDGPTSCCTTREALMEAAAVEEMGFPEFDDVSRLANPMRQALYVVAKNEGYTSRQPNANGKAAPFSTKEKPAEKHKLRNSKRASRSKNGQGGGKKTAPVGLTRTGPQQHHENVDMAEKASDICSDRSGALPPTPMGSPRNVGVANDDGTRGQKRKSSPRPMSILRQKVLRRSGQLNSHSPGYELLDQVIDVEDLDKEILSEREAISSCVEVEKPKLIHQSRRQIPSKSTTSSQPNRRPSSQVGQRRSMSEAPKLKSPNSVGDGRKAVISPCLRENCKAWSRLNPQRASSLRQELQTVFAAMRCNQNGVLKEAQSSTTEDSILRWVRLTKFWSDHKARLDETGYTKTAIPSITLTNAMLNAFRENMRDEIVTKNQSKLDKDDEDEEYLPQKRASRTQSANRARRSKRNAPRSEESQTSEDLLVIETAVAILSEWLGLFHVEDDIASHFISEPEHPVMSFPTSSEVRKPQLAIGLGEREENFRLWTPPKDPSYMFVVTADVGLPIWIWERAHVILQGPDELLPLLASHLKPKRVYIEPGSVFICRGDMLYAFDEPDFQIDNQRRKEPIAVVRRLVARSDDQKGQSVLPALWANYISTPFS